jgi:hypothetical protein
MLTREKAFLVVMSICLFHLPSSEYLTSLYLIVDNPQETAQTLNDDLVKLYAWSTKWLVNINPQKTETMTISRKLNKPHQPNLIMNNTIISTVTEHKHLGPQLSDDGNCNKHIDNLNIF